MEQAQPEIQVDKQFASTLKYRRKTSTARLLGEVRKLRTIDRIYEGKEKFWKYIGIAGVILFIPAIWVLAVFVDEHAAAVIPLLLAIGVATLGGIMCASRGRFNLENRRYELAHDILDALARDIASSSPISLFIDFNEYKRKEHLISEEKGGIFNPNSAFSYALPWFKLEGQFMDGVIFSLGLTLKVKRKEKRKRKYTKVREAFQEEVSLALKVKPAAFPGLEQLSEAMAQSSFPAGVTFKGVKVTRGRIAASVMTLRRTRVEGRYRTEGADALEEMGTRDAVLCLFLATYDALAKCKKAA